MSRTYNDVIADFCGTFPELKLIDTHTWKEYLGVDVLKRFFESTGEEKKRFVIAECIGKHDKDGTMLYRGDVVDGVYNGHVLRGAIDYDTEDARYKVYFSDGQVAVLGTDADEFELIEFVCHVSTFETDTYKKERDFYKI